MISLYSTVADAMHRRLLAAGAAGAAPTKHECVGRAEAGVGGCGPGKRPAVSLNALHEVHTFIFIMAITHIVTCALLIVCTTLRIRAWRRWEKKAPSPADVAAAVAGKKKARIELTAVRGGDDDKPNVAADEESAAAATATVDAAAAPVSPWRQRPEHLVGVWPRVREAIVCLGRQLLPNGEGGRVGQGCDRGRRLECCRVEWPLLTHPPSPNQNPFLSHLPPRVPAPALRLSDHAPRPRSPRRRLVLVLVLLRSVV